MLIEVSRLTFETQREAKGVVHESDLFWAQNSDLLLQNVQPDGGQGVEVSDANPAKAIFRTKQ